MYMNWWSSGTDWCASKMVMFIEGGMKCRGGLEIEKRTPDQCCINVDSIPCIETIEMGCA